FGQALPTTVGGDIVRVVYLKDRKADAFAVVVMDRLLGFLGLFIFALGVTFGIYLIQRQTFFLRFILIGIVVISFIITVLLSRRSFNLFSKLFLKIRFLKLGERINNVYGIINRFRSARIEILLCLLVSFLIQTVLAIGPYLVHRALPVKPISVGYFLLCVPLINIIAMIPISPGALGVRESSFVFFFPKFGLSEPSAFAISVLAKFIEIIIYVIGGTICYFRKR
ncbi:MAG TPA: flippase-like domain-containing protein, partial [bacterium (Candidatus Stahlbacteria)]|nr:flippase-like domain-containing protein [Candidatus Stahlbacteria bacterium]